MNAAATKAPKIRKTMPGTLPTEELKNDGTPEAGDNETPSVTGIAPAIDPGLRDETPAPPKRTRASYVKRTKAQIAEDAEKERIAKLGPIERIAERKRVLVAALEAADQHVILAQSNRATAAKDLEDYTEESKPELDRLIAELQALRG